MPLVNPDTGLVVVELVRPVQVGHAGIGVIVYAVIVAPPSEAGGFHEMRAVRSPGAAVTDRGAPGVVRGVIGADGVDAAPVPTALTAATVNVYAVPLLSPVTVVAGAVGLSPPQAEQAGVGTTA
jgi:hypothetical protein